MKPERRIQSDQLPAVGANEHAAVIDGAPIVREKPAPIDMSSFRPDPIAAAPADQPVADNPVPPPSDPPPHNNAAMATNGPRGYTLQVAAYQDAKKADTELMNLTSLGFDAYTVQNRTGSDVWYRLRVGVFERPEDAKVLMERLRAEQFNPILIKF
jgi:cell division protein FtsN